MRKNKIFNKNVQNASQIGDDDDNKTDKKDAWKNLNWKK